MIAIDNLGDDEMNISKAKWEEAKAITENLERRIISLRTAGICPGDSELLSARTLNRLLDECMEEFEAELNAMYDYDHGPSDSPCDEPIGFDMCGASGKN